MVSEEITIHWSIDVPCSVHSFYSFFEVSKAEWDKFSSEERQKLIAQEIAWYFSQGDGEQFLDITIK